MEKFLQPTKDIVFKSMWIIGNKYVRKYLERIVEYSIGYKLPEYTLGANATGIINYEAIANEVDILLICDKNHSKINVEMNRLGKYASKKNIFSAMNKSSIYLAFYANNFYNDLPDEERYKVPIKVEQVNLNEFYFEENKLIQELHFELVDKNYNISKDGIKSHQIFLPRMAELCYDKKDDIYKDFKLLVSKSYEDMEKCIQGDKCREEVIKFLKRLGSDENLMAVIDREEYNRIQQEITLENIEEEKENLEKQKDNLEKELKKATAESHEQGVLQGIEEKTKESAINLYNNGASKELICKSLNITIEKLDEYLKEI